MTSNQVEAPESTKARSSESPRTTILEAGTVESRGLGTAGPHEQVSDEIAAFIERRSTKNDASFGRLCGLLRAEVRAWWTVWIFLTRLPAPSWVDLHPGYLMFGMAYMTTVGMLLGIVASTWFDLAIVLLGMPPLVAACFSVAVSFANTLCFHEDGLADSADGIGGGWTRQQVLRIMTDTRLGTYG